MKTFKKLLKVTLVAACVALAFTACKKDGNEGSVKKRTIKVGCVVPATHPTTMAMMDKFKSMVEHGTNGEIMVDVYESGLLGGEKDLYNSVKNGSIDVVTLGTGMWDEFNKMLLPDWPFLYRDLEHARSVFTGPIADEISAEFNEKMNLYMIGGWGPNGARVFSSNKPLSSPAEFKGQRIRMPNNPIHIKLAELLGANVISMNMGDVFGALEQKVIDGQDNPMATIRSSGWYEVQKYIYNTNHMVSSIEIVASKKFIDSLSPEHKQVVIDAARAATEVSWDLYMDSINKDREYLSDSGIKITDPTDADKAEMIEKLAPLYDDLKSKYPWSEELTARISAVQ